MDYNHIKKYLDKFKIIVSKKEEVYISISDTINLFIKKKIDCKNITMKNNIVYIKTSPIIKSEINIYKKDIINSFKENIPDIKILDIK